MRGAPTASLQALHAPPPTVESTYPNAYASARPRESHIPHPFFWVYDGFQGILSHETWHRPIEPFQNMSLYSFLTSSRRCGASSTCERLQPGGNFPLPQQSLHLGLAHPALSARGRWTSALAILIALATPGRCEVCRRDTQCPEVLLLDRRQRVGELALGPYFEDQHRRKLGHHHESCRLVRSLLVPPWQRGLCGLHVDPECSLDQTPQQQRQQ